MCDAETDTGVCQVGGDEVVAQLQTRARLSFYATESTATTYACDLVSNVQGYDDTSGDGNTDVSSLVTNAARHTSVTGLFGKVWINCGTLSGGNVTIQMYVCPAGR